jgi:hypothetical protein
MMLVGPNRSALSIIVSLGSWPMLPGLVDLPVIGAERQTRDRLPHNSGVELSRFLGRKSGIAAGLKPEIQVAIRAAGQ